MLETNGELVLVAIAMVSIIGSWSMLLFRKSIFAAWITTGCLIYLSIFCFRVLDNMEFYGWGNAVLALMSVSRVWMLEKAKERVTNDIG